jgi:plasmid stability protein
MTGEDYMAQVLIRGLHDAVVTRLKARARSNGRSLEAELRALIDLSARQEADLVATRGLAAQLRRRLAAGKHTDSTHLVAEDRQR